MVNIQAQEVVQAARKLINTPFIHQGRLPGVGVDCIGLPILVAKALKLGDYDRSDYRRYPDGTMKEQIAAVCQPVKIQPGALLVFKISVAEQHCGFVSQYNRGAFGLIHAWDIVGKVVEHRLTQYWIKKTVGCYGLPGVDYHG